MLNACRRQRSVHAEHHLIVGPLHQVLNACRRQRSVHNSPSSVKITVRIRAQRLSASKIGSHADVRSGDWRGNVLNACRRQRSVHAQGPDLPGRSRKVLNACRRQRSVHTSGRSGQGTCVLVLNACRRQRSVHLHRFGDLLGRHLVLNACRRQRSVHRLKTSRFPSRFVCSTPVGVKDRFTAIATTPLNPACASAQRLSASKIGSLERLKNLQTAHP